MRSSLDTAALGQTAGFPLRSAWLPKLVQRGNFLPCPGGDGELACQLGIGINMVKALRYWARATGMVNKDGNLSSLCNVLIARDDKFVEREDTAWILHWNLASNLEISTAITWLYAQNELQQFTLARITEICKTHITHMMAHRKKPYATTTIKSDLETTLRMYAGGNVRSSEHDDDVFKRMGLLKFSRPGREILYSLSAYARYNQVPLRAIAYAVLCLLEKNGGPCAITQLWSGSNQWDGSLGGVFRINKETTHETVSALRKEWPSVFNLTAIPGDTQVSTKKSLAGAKEISLGFLQDTSEASR